MFFAVHCYLEMRSFMFFAVHCYLEIGSFIFFCCPLLSGDKELCIFCIHSCLKIRTSVFFAVHCYLELGSSLFFPVYYFQELGSPLFFGVHSLKRQLRGLIFYKYFPQVGKEDVPTDTKAHSVWYLRRWNKQMNLFYFQRGKI